MQLMANRQIASSLIARNRKGDVLCPGSHLFRSSYLEAGCVSGLKSHLDQKGIKSKVRVSANGTRSGGTPYSRGALYQILKNRVAQALRPRDTPGYPAGRKCPTRRPDYSL